MARVDDRPRRQEQDRRLAGSVDLVEDAHAVTLDVALLVRVAGARLLALVRCDDHASLSPNSRRMLLTTTGSRTCGACPEPSSRTRSARACSASARPRVCDAIA